MSGDRFLYWSSGSPPSWRVLITLEEKGLQYKDKLCVMSNKEHKSDEVLALNPRGQMPTFRDGNIIINESLGTIEYLESVYADQGNKLLPEDPAGKALVMQRKVEELNLQKKFGEELVFYIKGHKPEERDPEVYKAKVDAFLKELTTWEGYLKQQGEGAHIAGKDFSLADVMFFPHVAFFVRLGLKLEGRFPFIQAYYNQVVQRPSVQKTWPPHWKDSPSPNFLASV